MKHYTPDELAEHIKWRKSNKTGKYADLQGVNLQGADLRGSYLRGANLTGANLQRADLRGADLRRTYLTGADLRGANLQGADLQGADLRRADLRDAYLTGANLQDAYLTGADLRDADLQDAYLHGIKIKKTAVFSGLYKYIAMPVIAEDGVEYIQLGCHFRLVSEWEANFWNNPSEFPEDGSTGSLQRLMAYQACLEWLRINRESVRISLKLSFPRNCNCPEA
jgi:uncharacterized protein YjbI with pentapeptide repeats